MTTTGGLPRRRHTGASTRPNPRITKIRPGADRNDFKRKRWA